MQKNFPRRRIRTIHSQESPSGAGDNEERSDRGFGRVRFVNGARTVESSGGFSGMEGTKVRPWIGLGSVRESRMVEIGERDRGK